MNVSKSRKSFIAAAQAAREAVTAGQTMLVACVLLTIEAGPFEPADLIEAGYPEGSAKSYASQWNLGDRAAGIIGDKAAREAVEATAAKSPTRAYEAVLAQLRSLKDAAETAGVELAKGKAVKVPSVTIGRKVAKIATALATEKAETRKAGKGAQGPQAPSMEAIRAQLASVASWNDVSRLALALSHAVQELAPDPDRQGACDAMKVAAASLAEAGAPFRVKLVKGRK